MKKFTVLTLFVFVLALLFGVTAAMAQASGGMDNTPGGGTSNTPGSYEGQVSFSGGMLLAQDGGVDQPPTNPGMSNTTGGLPTLTGNYTATFQSASMDSAQQICDQVARANNKASCTAASTMTKGTVTGNTYYCVCK